MRGPRKIVGARLVADLRASAAAHQELEWFFERALSDIEVPSNYGAMVKRAIYGGRRARRDSRQADWGAERRADAMHAARIIYERLDRLRTYDRWVIRTLYEPAVWPDELVAAWGWLTPLVCALPATADRYEDARRRGRTRAVGVKEWLVETVGVFGVEPLEDLVTVAQATAAGAIEEYERARSGQRESLVPDAEGEQ